MQRGIFVSLIGCLFVFFMGCSSNSTNSTTVNMTGASTTAPQASLVLTSLANGYRPQSHFSTPDTIYATLNFPENFEGSHLLEGYWIAPDGTTQERSQVQLNFSKETGHAAYVWIRFNESSLLDHLKMGDEDSSALNIGPWTFEAVCNGVSVAKSTFSVTMG